MLNDATTPAVTPPPARPYIRPRPMLNVPGMDDSSATSQGQVPAPTSQQTAAPEPPQVVAQAKTPTPRQSRLIQDIRGIRDAMGAIDADTNLSTVDRTAQLLQQRRLLRQKTTELQDAAADALPPAQAKQVQLAKDMRELQGHMKTLASNPLLSQEERRSIVNRHADATREKAKQIKWLQAQPPETDVDAPEPVVP